jgi:hypothetical protein
MARLKPSWPSQPALNATSLAYRMLHPLAAGLAINGCIVINLSLFVEQGHLFIEGIIF